MCYEVSPTKLSWPDVDPQRHPFDGGSAYSVVCALPPAAHVPSRPRVEDELRRSRPVGDVWVKEMTTALVERFGPWAAGWCWAHGEGDIGGGPVVSWCCPFHSIDTPGQTLRRVAAGLCEWRDWLEELAVRFDDFPLDAASADDRRRTWHRAAAHLITCVVDATDADHTWYAHCAQVLKWYLTHWGIGEAQAASLVEPTLAGRFESWVEPDSDVVDAVATDLADALGPDHA